MAGVALLFPAAAVAMVACVAAGAAGASASTPAGRVFIVGGGPRGWSQPTPSDETYNHWAAKNRFHVGDFLDFNDVKNDSVLLVSRDDYKLCNASRPEQRFDAGGALRFRLDRNGDFYFISGAPGHCDAGQRMTLRVMSQHDGDNKAGGDAPAAAPAPGDDEDDSGGSFSSRTPGSGWSSSSPPTQPHGKSSAAAAAVSPSRGGGHHAARVAAAAAVLLVFA